MFAWYFTENCWNSLQQTSLPRFILLNYPKVPVGIRCCKTPAGCPVQETLLDQEWFIYIFNSVLVFTDSCRNRFKTDRTAAEFLDNSQEELAVHYVKAPLVYLEHSKRLSCHIPCNNAVSLYLSIVPDPPEQAVGNPRCPP